MNPKASLKVRTGPVVGCSISRTGVRPKCYSVDERHRAFGGNAVGHAWQGSKTAVKDTDITAKVKIALHNDKFTKGKDIHVVTRDGVVTLTGHASEAAAGHAARLARDTTGVVSVNNDLRAGQSMSAR